MPFLLGFGNRTTHSSSALKPMAVQRYYPRRMPVEAVMILPCNLHYSRLRRLEAPACSLGKSSLFLIHVNLIEAALPSFDGVSKISWSINFLLSLIPFLKL